MCVFYRTLNYFCACSISSFKDTDITTPSYQLPGNIETLTSNKSLLPGNKAKIFFTTKIQVQLSNANNTGDNADPGNRLKQIMKKDDDCLRRNDSR